MKRKEPNFLLFAALGMLMVILVYFNEKVKIMSVNSFESCQNTGYPVMGYPKQCKTPDGRSFTEVITREEFCGTSTRGPCKTDKDCMISGCSGQICQSKNEEELITTCEYTECYNAATYLLSCLCIDKQCQWS